MMKSLGKYIIIPLLVLFLLYSTFQYYTTDYVILDTTVVAASGQLMPEDSVRIINQARRGYVRYNAKKDTLINKAEYYKSLISLGITDTFIVEMPALEDIAVNDSFLYVPKREQDSIFTMEFSDKNMTMTQYYELNHGYVFPPVDSLYALVTHQQTDYNLHISQQTEIPVKKQGILTIALAFLSGTLLGLLVN